MQDVYTDLLCVCRDLRKALFGRYKRKERVDDDRRDDRRGGPRGGRDDYRDRRRDRSPGDRRGRQALHLAYSKVQWLHMQCSFKAAVAVMQGLLATLTGMAGKLWLSLPDCKQLCV